MRYPVLTSMLRDAAEVAERWLMLGGTTLFVAGLVALAVADRIQSRSVFDVAATLRAGARP